MNEIERQLVGWFYGMLSLVQLVGTGVTFATN